MQIKFLHIKNFKSIQELKIADIENSLILVGKNNTGKTAVLDAIRLATGNYELEERNFNDACDYRRRIETISSQWYC